MDVDIYQELCNRLGFSWFQSYKQILSAHDAGVEKKMNKMIVQCLPAHPTEKCGFNRHKERKYELTNGGCCCAIVQLKKARSGPKQRTVAISGWELPSSHFSGFTEFKSFSELFLEKNYFPSSNLTSRGIQRVSNCSIVTSTEGARTNYILLFHQI